MKDRGFTVVELIVVLSLVGMLVSLAVPRLKTAKIESYDNKASATLEQLKQQMITTDLGSDAEFFVNETSGPAALPEPFSGVRLDDQIKLNFALSLKLFGRYQLKAIQLNHLHSDKIYRFIEIDHRIR